MSTRRRSTKLLILGLLISGGAGVGLAFANADTAINRCEPGHVAAYAVVTGNRLSGPGGIPSRTTTAQAYFAKRYNCTGQLPGVRRVDAGIYDVSFPGSRALAVNVAALNPEATTASAQPLGNGGWRVVLKGGRIENGVLIARDTSFSIVVVN